MKRKKAAIGLFILSVSVILAIAIHFALAVTEEKEQERVPEGIIGENVEETGTALQKKYIIMILAEVVQGYE